MRNPIWSDVIPEHEIRIYEKAGYNKNFGFGKKPALLIVDVEYGFVGIDPKDDILEAIDKFPNSCGKAAWQAVGEIRKAIEIARTYAVPILYVHSRRKKDARPVQGFFGDEIVGPIKPKENDIVIEKEGYSAFFGTNLVSQLIGLNVDTLVVTGCVTSGCIRASVIDAYAYKFKVLIPWTCVFDRAIVPHKVNLFDMKAKYADLMSLEELSTYFQGVSAT